jgi:hypothetical protein
MKGCKILQIALLVKKKDISVYLFVGFSSAVRTLSTGVVPLQGLTLTT